MYQYETGLQLHSDKPEHILNIIALDSNKAWDIAQDKYRQTGQFSTAELTTMVLWNETKITDLHQQRNDLEQKIKMLYQQIDLYKSSKKQLTRQINNNE